MIIFQFSVDDHKMKLCLLIYSGFDERRGRGDRGNANLDPAHELDVPANREFYKHNDVRPPYTYAALIRYVSLTRELSQIPD